MTRTPPLSPSLLLMAAACSVAFAVAGETSEWIRDRAEARLMNEVATPESGELPDWLARLWPDESREAWIGALREMRRPNASARSVRSALRRACQLIPRSGVVHLYLARVALDSEEALVERSRALRTDPFHGIIQAEVAREILLEAVRRDDPSLLETAARAFAVAIETGHVEMDEALCAMEAASAPSCLFEYLAGGEPERWSLLIDHHARAGRFDEALKLGERLDADRGRDTRDGQARAHIKIAVSLRASGNDREALEHFAEASRCSSAPDAFALDYADALFAAGRPEEGAVLLMRALEKEALTPSRVAGSLLDAEDPRKAIEALRRHAASRSEVAVLGAAEAARNLGDFDLAREILEPSADGRFR